MKIFKYEIIDENFPYNNGNYELTSYHLKNIFVRKSIFNITLWIRWYSGHINGDHWYLITNKEPLYMGRILMVDSDQEQELNNKFVKEFDEFHKNRLYHHRNNVINDILK